MMLPAAFARELLCRTAGDDLIQDCLFALELPE
jgi:hypothetical protein